MSRVLQFSRSDVYFYPWLRSESQSVQEPSKHLYYVLLALLYKTAVVSWAERSRNDVFNIRNLETKWHLCLVLMSKRDGRLNDEIFRSFTHKFSVIDMWQITRVTSESQTSQPLINQFLKNKKFVFKTSITSSCICVLNTWHKSVLKTSRLTLCTTLNWPFICQY